MVSTITQSMLQAIIHQWKLQNQHLYPTNNLQEDCTQLQAIVNQILHDAQQDPNLQDMVVAVNHYHGQTHPQTLTVDQ